MAMGRPPLTPAQRQQQLQQQKENEEARWLANRDAIQAYYTLNGYPHYIRVDAPDDQAKPTMRGMGIASGLMQINKILPDGLYKKEGDDEMQIRLYEGRAYPIPPATAANFYQSYSKVIDFIAATQGGCRSIKISWNDVDYVDFVQLVSIIQLCKEKKMAVKWDTGGVIDRALDKMPIDKKNNILALRDEANLIYAKTNAEYYAIEKRLTFDDLAKKITATEKLPQKLAAANVANLVANAPSQQNLLDSILNTGQPPLALQGEQKVEALVKHAAKIEERFKRLDEATKALNEHLSTIDRVSKDVIAGQDNVDMRKVQKLHDEDNAKKLALLAAIDTERADLRLMLTNPNAGAPPLNQVEVLRAELTTMETALAANPAPTPADTALLTKVREALNNPQLDLAKYAQYLTDTNPAPLRTLDTNIKNEMMQAEAEQSQNNRIRP